MRLKRTIQITVDALMTVLLLVLFAVPWTDTPWHERLGLLLFAAFFMHNALNFRWYAALPNGPYPLRRILWTAVNIGLLAALLLTLYSGVMISQHAFTFLHLDGSLLWKKIHLSAAHWSLVLARVYTRDCTEPPAPRRSKNIFQLRF